MEEGEKTLNCDLCSKLECFLGFRKGKPAVCQSTKYEDALSKSLEKLNDPEISELYKASQVVLQKLYEGNVEMPRILQAIEYAKVLSLQKIGLATCRALLPEASMIADLFRLAGFDVISAICKVGGVTRKDGIREEHAFPRAIMDLYNLQDIEIAICNPMGQAEILNSAGTELNFSIGLCMGHDVVFNRLSKAPVSTLIVKDGMTGHSPAALLYTYHGRNYLMKQLGAREPRWPPPLGIGVSPRPT